VPNEQRRDDPSSCPNNGNKRPKNDVVDCASLPQLDFTLWEDDMFKKAYSY